MADAPRPPLAPGARLTLRLHGTPHIAGPDGQEVVLERRAAALCALVALQPGFPRERAAAWLWPDSNNGRRNLRQQLLRFKRQHGHAVLAGEDRLRLAEGLRFETGDALLPGQSFEDCEAFAQWLQAQRDAQRQARAATQRQALAEAEAAGDLQAALAAAEALVAADPAVEEPLRELMRVHYLRADAAAGLAVHQRLLHMMASEHGARPSAASEQLAVALRQTQPAAAPALGRIAPTLLRPPRMVGRGQELRAVHEAWAAGQAVLLLGEPGMGKSRLMADCCAGAQAVSVAGRPGDTMSPYATLARLLRPLQAVAEGGLSGAARSPLADGMPRQDAPASPDTQAAALQQATAALVLHADVATVAVDDLHFADAASIDLLTALAQAAPARQYWIFALRPGESTPAIQALRDTLESSQRLVTVALAPLDEAAMVELVDTLGIEGLHGGALAPTLVRHTGGNPLFLLETLKQGLFDGSLARGELPRPDTVGALIERRLQRLSPRALMLARVAAMAGVDFCIELAEEAIGVRAVELAGAWDELQVAQVLRDEAFAHDLVADAVQRGIPAVVARRMHAQCAQWLEARHGDPARNAWHWWHADEPARAAAAFEASASRAASAGRRREEADLYAQAAAGWARAGRPDKAFEARADRIDALTRADFGPLALQEARELQAMAIDDAQRLRAARTEIDLLANRGQAADVLPRAREALALARRLDLPGEQLAISGPLAGCLTQLGHADEAHDVLKVLQPWIEASAEPLQKQVWFGYMATALLDLGQIAEAVRLREAQLAIALQLDVKPVAVVAYNHLGVAHGARGFPRPAVAACRQGVALCAQMPGDVTRTSLARLTLARQLTDDGSFGEALEILEEVLAHFQAAGSAFWTEAAALALAGLWIRLGQPGRARGLLDRDEAQLAARHRAQRRLLALELAAAMGKPLPETLADEACAAMPGDLGQALVTRAAALRARPFERAFDEAQDLLRALRRHERRGGEAAAWVWRARAATALQRHDEACHAAQRLGELLALDCAPESMYRGEAYLQAWQTWKAAGHADAARQALHAGVAWVQQRALPQVPPAFVDGFLHRQQANRSLLAALGREA